MNRIYIFITLAALSVLFFSFKHKETKLLVGGSGWNKIAIIDKESKKVEWEHPLEKGWECNSVSVTRDGNILFSYGKGAKLITKDHKELWNINAPEGSEMQTARVLPNGHCLLAWCGHPAAILEVDGGGIILKKTEYDTGVEHTHAQFRQVNKNKRGNYLIPVFETSDIREVSPKGELIKKVKVPGNPFSVVPLSNGNLLVGCGDSHQYIELNFNKEIIVRSVTEKQITGAPLSFVAELFAKADGGVYICNWQGHGNENEKKSESPKLIELNKKGNIIWSLSDYKETGMISAICPFNY